mmetsp:Transcript_13298/g.42952  ORF Transcript_13298/g.42952 Transcript_13298/m.42952 type:complete len:266 (+) Transcript_13298:544-1341(+)
MSTLYRRMTATIGSSRPSARWVRAARGRFASRSGTCSKTRRCSAPSRLQLKVLDAQREGERDGGFVRVRTHRLISVWLSARWAKVPLDPAHAPPLLASEPAPSLEECVFLLRCLANGAPALDSLDALLTGEDIEDIIRKHDELSLQPASNVEFARLWEKLVDGMAYFFGFERSTARWVDAATFSRMLSRKKLKVDSEETVLRAFLDWAEVPGREAVSTRWRRSSASLWCASAFRTARSRTPSRASTGAAQSSRRSCRRRWPCSRR